MYLLIAFLHDYTLGCAHNSLCLQRAKQLADEVKEQVKALGCHRHKIVVQVEPYGACYKAHSCTVKLFTKPVTYGSSCKSHGIQMSSTSDCLAKIGALKTSPLLDCYLWMQILLGQRKGQAMRAVSRCLWDVHTDVAAAVTHESETMYCVCQVRSSWKICTFFHTPMKVSGTEANTSGGVCHLLFSL